MLVMFDDEIETVYAAFDSEEDLGRALSQISERCPAAHFTIYAIDAAFGLHDIHFDCKGKDLALNVGAIYALLSEAVTDWATVDQFADQFTGRADLIDEATGTVGRFDVVDDAGDAETDDPFAEDATDSPPPKP